MATRNFFIPKNLAELQQGKEAGASPAQGSTGLLPRQNPLSTSKLYPTYIKAMETYCHSVNARNIPIFLYQPLLFFYLRNPGNKSSEIYSISSFTYGTKQSHKLTRKTFPAFLVNTCYIPYNPGSYFETFYSAFNDLVRLSPRTRLQIVIEHIKHQAPYFAAWLTLFPSILVSKDRNLFVPREQLSQLNSYPVAASSPYQSVLTLAQEKILPAPLMRQYLNALLAEYDEGIGDHNMPEEVEPTANSIVFRETGSGDSAVVTAQYQFDSDTFALSTHPSSLCRLKTIPTAQVTPLQRIPQDVTLLFQGLCGDNTALLDKMAMALAQAADPVSGNGMTVFYSKHNQTVLDGILHQLFQDSAVSLNFKAHAKSNTAVPSLNQITKKENLLQMFLAQTNGASVMFVRDLFPSDVSLKTVRILLRGRNSSITSPACPPQHYQNNLHFLCVTEDYSRAQDLQKKLKAQLIDLSMHEVPLGGFPPLSSEAVHWLRTAFLLHGLRLRTLTEHQMPDPATPIPVPLPSLQDEIQSFLDGACTKERGRSCDTFYLYECFLDFYRQRHPGKEPDTTKISFNKSVRNIVKRSHAKTITYQKLRPDSRSTPLWHYVGLYPNKPSSPVSPQTEASEMLPSHLSRIHQYQLQLGFPCKTETVVKELAAPL